MNGTFVAVQYTSRTARLGAVILRMRKPLLRRGPALPGMIIAPEAPRLRTTHGRGVAPATELDGWSWLLTTAAPGLGRPKASCARRGAQPLRFGLAPLDGV